MKTVKRSLIILCAFVLICLPAFLSPFYPSSVHGDDWLPINPEDLALKDNPKQPGADAMILYRSSHIDAKRADIDGDFTEEYMRIKIFTQEGTKQADREIEFVKENADIKDIRARTIHPDGTIINFDGKVFEKTVVKLSGFRYLAKTFTLPDVRPGSIIEYKYRRQTKPGYVLSQEWILSSSLYTREVHFSIIPYAREGGLPLFFRQYGLPSGTIPEKQPNGSFAMSAHDIVGIEDEPYMPPEKALQARVEFYYRDLDEPNNETPEHFWARKGKKYNDTFEGFISKKGTLEKEVARITASSDSPDVKLQKICARVREIRDLGLEEGKSEKERKKENLKDNSSVDDLLKHGYGYGRQLDYLFAGLARAAGYESSVVFVSTRDRNIFNPNMMDPSELNGDIIWVRAAGKEYWIDPSSRYFPLNTLPWPETGTQGLRLNKQGTEFVKLPMLASSDSVTSRHADLEVADDGGATGKIQIDFIGQRAGYMRLDNRATDETGRKKAVVDQVKSWLPAGSNFELTSLTNWENSDQPLHIEGTVSIPNFGSTVGRRVLVPLSIFQSEDVKSFQNAKRVNPIYIHYPYQETDEIRIHAPAGYRIESAPQPKTHKPGAVSYEITPSQESSVIVVKRHLDINAMFFARDNYRALQAFFNNVKTDDEAQAAFQRAEAASAKN